MLAKRKQLLPQIKAVAQLAEPCDGADIQNPERALHHVQQESCDGKMHQRPEDEQEKRRGVKAQHAHVDGNEQDGQKHRCGPRSRDPRHALRVKRQPASDRENVSHGGEEFIGASMRSQKVASDTKYRSRCDRSDPDQNAMVMPLLQNAWPQKIELLLHTQ